MRDTYPAAPGMSGMSDTYTSDTCMSGIPLKRPEAFHSHPAWAWPTDKHPANAGAECRITRPEATT